MGRGTQIMPVTSGFDALMGTRRGLSPSQEQVRIERIKAAVWSAIWAKELDGDAAKELSEIAADITPGVQVEIRSILQALIRTTGLTSFANNWKDSRIHLGRGLQDAMRDAAIAYLQEDGRSPFDKRLEASGLVGVLFLGDEDDELLSHSEVEAYLPLIEAIGRIYREERLADAASGNEHQQRSCESLAACLGAYPSQTLPFFKSWRDELMVTVAMGGCDANMGDLLIMLRRSRRVAPNDPIIDDALAAWSYPTFLKPLHDVIEGRTKGHKGGMTWDGHRASQQVSRASSTS